MIETLSRELLPKIAALTDVESALPVFPVATGGLIASGALAPAQSITPAPSIVVVGISTGGPAALDILLPAIPASFPLPVLIVQHMPELFTRLLAERLDQRCSLRVTEAAEGDAVRPGHVAIARGNWHMEVLSPARGGQAATLHLTQAPPENHCRPAADVLFRTAAAHYGSAVIGVVLTGMGSDGLTGSRLIRSQGGTVLVQDQATSAIWGMPGAVARAGLAQRVLPIGEIAPELLRLVSRSQTVRVDSREAVAQ